MVVTFAKNEGVRKGSREIEVQGQVVWIDQRRIAKGQFGWTINVWQGDGGGDWLMMTVPKTRLRADCLRVAYARVMIVLVLVF